MKNKLALTSLMVVSFVGGKLTQTDYINSAATDPQIALPATVVSVHDGDTMRVRFEVETSVRMLDCWSAELKDGEKGLQAKENLLKLCPDGSKVLIRIPFSSDISKMFTFGRVLGRVYKDGKDLSEEQVKEGFATTTKKK